MLKHDTVILYLLVESGADPTCRTSSFKWPEPICARREALNTCLQLALTPLLLDSAGSQPRCVVRHASISNTVKDTLGPTLASSCTSSASDNINITSRCPTETRTKTTPHRHHFPLSSSSFPHLPQLPPQPHQRTGNVLANNC